MAADDPQPDTKPRLAFGTLSNCGTCGRRKREPGAVVCPDCLAIGRLSNRYGELLAHIYERWLRDQPTSLLRRTMARDEDYQSFKSLDELMNAYEAWLG